MGDGEFRINASALPVNAETVDTIVEAVSVTLLVPPSTLIPVELEAPRDAIAPVAGVRAPLLHARRRPSSDRALQRGAPVAGHARHRRRTAARRARARAGARRPASLARGAALGQRRAVRQPAPRHPGRDPGHGRLGERHRLRLARALQRRRPCHARRARERRHARRRARDRAPRPRPPLALRRPLRGRGRRAGVLRRARAQRADGSRRRPRRAPEEQLEAAPSRGMATRRDPWA